MIPVLFCKILSLISFILLVVGTAFPEWESLPTGKFLTKIPSSAIIGSQRRHLDSNNLRTWVRRPDTSIKRSLIFFMTDDRSPIPISIMLNFKPTKIKVSLKTRLYFQINHSDSKFSEASLH